MQYIFLTCKLTIGLLYPCNKPTHLECYMQRPHAVVIPNKMMKPLQEANIFNMPSFYVRVRFVQSVSYEPL